LLFVGVSAACAALIRCSAFGTSESSGPVAEGGATDGGTDSTDTDSQSTPADAGCGHTFCDNFDRPGAPFDPLFWSAELGSAPHSFSSTSASPPNALFVDLGDAGAGYYFLEKTFTGPLALP
jgi:hypothetical protein